MKDRRSKFLLAIAAAGLLSASSALALPAGGIVAAAGAPVCSRPGVVCYYAEIPNPRRRHLVAFDADRLLFGPDSSFDPYQALAANVAETDEMMRELDAQGAAGWRRRTLAALAEVRSRLANSKRRALIDPEDLPTHWEDLDGRAAANVRADAQIDKKIAAVDGAARSLRAPVRLERPH